ncbi:hypothetical protein AVEN_164925-1 [Araneus ventricosus]|uniref:Uncharacterized protein n=1 Tax=Araneus ventricosus TaxID=182803 RepID=A0A4Y2FWJ2_ARAVE|nr:hypothetical protein AVEN_164925-1 [Araneus ventricosus]
MWYMRSRSQRISSKRNLPWKRSQSNIQHPGASSKRSFRPSPPNSGRMNGTTVTLEGTNIILPKNKIPQLRGKDQKSCLQREIAHSQRTLREFVSERLIAVVAASYLL